MESLPTAFLFIISLSVILRSTDAQAIQMTGTNVYSVTQHGVQYFIYKEEMDATITCRVSGTSSTPNIEFLKGGRSVKDVLPDSLFELEYAQSDDGQSHTLKLKINATCTGGYQDIVGNWSCLASTTADEQPLIRDFVTICTSRPEISFSPPLRNNVARQGTTITLSCGCQQLDVFRGDMNWGWFVGGSSPAGTRFDYANSPDGYPTDTMIIYDLEDIDSAEYSCNCIIGEHKTIQFTSHVVSMIVREPPGKPKDIELLEKTMNSLDISWKNSDNMGVVISYQISYKRGQDSSYRQILRVKDTRYTLTGLDPLTEYNIKIVASNYAGEGDYSNVAVFNTSQPSESKPLIHSPKNVFYNQESQTYLIDVGPGVDIKLRCEVQSYPAPVVEWLKDGQEILTSNPDPALPGNFERSFERKTDFTVESVLVIRKTRDVNTGEYTCVAANTKGRDTLNYELRVTPTEEEAEQTRDGSLPVSLHSILLLLLSVLWAAV